MNEDDPKTEAGDPIVDAIENRDMNGAAAAMRSHLRTVERKLLDRQVAQGGD